MNCPHCGIYLRQGTTFCTGCGSPVGSGQSNQRKTSEERKELLARQIANKVPQGWRVESQSDYQAVFVSGRPVNHVLHLILTLITCLAWGIVWVSLSLFAGEKRGMANIDEYGNVAISRFGNTTGKVVAGIVGGIFLLILLLIIIGAISSISEEAAGTQQGQAGGATLPNSTTSEPVTKVNAQEILKDYQTNETAANINWKGKRLLVTLDNIDEIEDGGRVIKYSDTLGWSHIQMDFTRNLDVVDLIPGNSVTANCRLEGYQMDSWLEFSDCSIE